MVESSRQVQFSDPYERFDEAISDPRLYPAQPYQRPESTQLEPLPHDRVPLFLSDYDQHIGSDPKEQTGWADYVKANNRLAEEFVKLHPTGDDHVYVLTAASWREFHEMKGR